MARPHVVATTIATEVCKAVRGPLINALMAAASDESVIIDDAQPRKAIKLRKWSPGRQVPLLQNSELAPTGENSLLVIRRRGSWRAEESRTYLPRL